MSEEENKVEVQEININDIKLNSEWVRQTGDVSDLIDSISSIGLINPLIINTEKELLCGGRRLSAMKALGWETARCITYSLGDLESDLVAVEDNIIRKNFEGPALARALDRRKELYQAKYPESVQYRAGAVARDGGEKVDSFAKDVSKKLQKDVKTINRMVARSRESHPKIMEMWENKEISPSKIDKLIKLPQEQQLAVVDLAKKMDTRDLDFYVKDIQNRGYDVATMTIKKDKGATSAYKRVIRNAEALRTSIHACSRFEFEEPLHGYLELSAHLKKTDEELAALMSTIPHHKEESEGLQGKDAAAEQNNIDEDGEIYLNSFVNDEETEEQEEFEDETDAQEEVEIDVYDPQIENDSINESFHEHQQHLQ